MDKKGKKAAEHTKMWRTIKYVRYMYPKFQERAYFVPPVYMNRVPYREEKSQGQTIRIPVYVPKESPKFNDVLEDRSMQDIMQNLHALLDRQVEDAQGEPVVVISQLKYKDFLNNAPKIKMPKPTDPELKGEFDIIFVSKHYGLIAGEVKAVGSDFSGKTDMQQDRSVVGAVDKAVSQLDKADKMLKEKVKSAPLIRKALMLPNVTRSQLRRALDNDQEVRQNLCQCLEVEDPAHLADVCLTSSDLSDGKPPQDAMPVVVTSLRVWWNRAVAAPVVSLTDDVYEDLVSSFVGPATTIRVPVPWQDSRFRKDVRSVGEGVAETSRRFTSGIVLHPHQLGILNRDDPLVWLCGPPGTGKTVMLVLMARTWLSRGWHVHVISAFKNSLAASHLIAHQLQEIDRELQQQQTDQDPQQQSHQAPPQQQSEQDPQRQHSRQKPQQQQSEQKLQPPSEQKSPQRSEQKQQKQSKQKRQQQSKHKPQQQSEHEPKELQDPQQHSAVNEYEQRVHHHVFDFGEWGQPESAVDRLVRLAVAADSGRPTCVVADEASDVLSFGNGFTKFCEDLQKRHVPNLRLWAASLYHDNRPQGLTGFPMQVSLRTPPVVTAQVQKTDLIVSDERVFDYDIDTRDHGGTNQSANQATSEHEEDSAKKTMYAALPPTCGPPVIVLVHEGPNHETDKGPIDCEACGKGIADKLADLHVSKPGPKEVEAPLTYRDVFLLTTKNDISFNDDEDDDDHASSGLSNIASDVGGAAKSASGMVRGLRSGGVPVKVVKPDDAEAIKNAALMAGPDQVMATSAWTVCGLERAVVVWVKTDRRTCSGMLGRQVVDNWLMDDVGGRLHAMSRTTAQLIVVAWPGPAGQGNHRDCCYT